VFLAYTRALFTTVLALRRGRGTVTPTTRETQTARCCSVATESEYIGLKASRRSVTYTHLTACTHSSSRERTNNARTSSAREVGHERTAIALPASSHLGDRRVTAHGAFTYAHAPRRRVFAHTRGAVRVRTYLRVRTRRCVLAGNRQTSWLEWGRGGGGERVNTASTTRRHARSARRSLQPNASCRARQLVCMRRLLAALLNTTNRLQSCRRPPKHADALDSRGALPQLQPSSSVGDHETLELC